MEDVWMRLEGVGIKLSSTSCWENHRDPTLTQQNLIKEMSESRQSMLQESKYCHCVLPVSPASELNTYKKPLPYSATLVAFYLLAMSKNLKLKALSIMSFPVFSHTVAVATMESWQRYWCLHKQQQREERCLTDPQRSTMCVWKAAPLICQESTRTET